jgi:gas vesicle protein
MAAKEPAKSRKTTSAVPADAAPDVAEVEAPPQGGLDLATRVAADRARNEDGVRCDPGGDWCDPADRATRIRPRIVSSTSDEAKETLAEIKRKALEANPGPGGVPSLFPRRLPLKVRREIDRDFAVSLLRGDGLGIFRWGDEAEHCHDLAGRSTAETQQLFMEILTWAPGQTWIVEDILRMASLIDRPETSDRTISDVIKKKARSLGLASKLSALADKERQQREKALALAEGQLSRTNEQLSKFMESYRERLQEVQKQAADDVAVDPSTEQPTSPPTDT